MESLDFGWEFGLIMMLILCIIYYLIATLNYLLTIIIFAQLKKLFDLTAIGKNKSISSIALPAFISATVIYFTVIQLLCVLANKYLYNDAISVLIWKTYYYYLTGPVGYIIGLTCLSLTRYSFAKDWKIMNKLKRKIIVSNFILWTTIVLVLNFICKTLSQLVFQFWLLYPLFLVLATYLFLKWRCINKPIKDN